MLGSGIVSLDIRHDGCSARVSWVDGTAAGRSSRTCGESGN